MDPKAVSDKWLQVLLPGSLSKLKLDVSKAFYQADSDAAALRLKANVAA